MLQARVVRNESHRGWQRYLCHSCQTYFGETLRNANVSVVDARRTGGPSPADRDSARKLTRCGSDHCLTAVNGDRIEETVQDRTQRCEMEWDVIWPDFWQLKEG